MNGVVEDDDQCQRGAGERGGRPQRGHQRDSKPEHPEAERRHPRGRDLAGRNRAFRPLVGIDRAIEVVVEVHAADIEQRHREHTMPVRQPCTAPAASTVPASTSVQTVGRLETRPSFNSVTCETDLVPTRIRTAPATLR